MPSAAGKRPRSAVYPILNARFAGGPSLMLVVGFQPALSATNRRLRISHKLVGEEHIRAFKIHAARNPAFQRTWRFEFRSLGPDVCSGCSHLSRSHGAVLGSSTAKKGAG